MKTIHTDYQEIIAISGVFVAIFLISLLSGFASDLAYFWMAGLLSILIVTLGVAISHEIKKRKKVMSDENKNTSTQCFYSYWPYEHPPWM